MSYLCGNEKTFSNIGKKKGQSHVSTYFQFFHSLPLLPPLPQRMPKTLSRPSIEFICDPSHRHRCLFSQFRSHLDFQWIPTRSSALSFGMPHFPSKPIRHQPRRALPKRFQVLWETAPYIIRQTSILRELAPPRWIQIHYRAFALLDGGVGNSHDQIKHKECKINPF